MKLKRTLAAIVALGLVVLLLVEVGLVADLYSFELAPLFSMIGWRGLLIIAALNLAILLILWALLDVASGRRVRHPKLTWAASILSAVLALWILDWTLNEIPLTIRHKVSSAPAPELTLPPSAEQDFRNFSLTGRATSEDSRRQLRTMYARALINNPEAYDSHPIGATIDRYASRYGIDPVFLFFRTYLISYYGEATSGPVPFLRSLTSEGIRDIVQVHLPSWFVESRMRRYLISSTFLPRIFGDAFGTKLRYAIHKATLDVSAQPYDLSTYSDVFGVLALYPGEFADILDNPNTDPLRAALRDSFLALKDTALVKPLEQPYRTQEYAADYYDEHRDDLKRFARAAYYLTVSDFDFATRIQALLSDHHRSIYRTHLSDETWAGLPDWQRDVMLAMPRDLFTPNIGKLAYNLYAIPELNCTPVEYIASSAAAETGMLQPDMATVWRPPNRDYLWAAAGYQLTVLNELWSLVNATPMPGISVNDTVLYAERVVEMNRSKLDQ